MEERALLLAVDVIVDPGGDCVQVSRIRVVRPLVRAAQLLRVDAAVLEILMVPGVGIGRRLSPPRLPGEGAGEGEDVVVRRAAGEGRLGKAKLFAVSTIWHLHIDLS